MAHARDERPMPVSNVLVTLRQRKIPSVRSVIDLQCGKGYRSAKLSGFTHVTEIRRTSTHIGSNQPFPDNLTASSSSWEDRSRVVTVAHGQTIRIRIPVHRLDTLH